MILFRGPALLRWEVGGNFVEIVLLDISDSTKPYPSVFRASASSDELA